MARDAALEVFSGGLDEAIRALEAEEACHALCRRTAGCSLDEVLLKCSDFRNAVVGSDGDIIPSGPVLLALLSDSGEDD